MLQISKIRENKEEVVTRLAKRNFKNPALVHKLLETDEQHRQLKVSGEQMQAAINSASKSIGRLMRKGKREEAEQQKREVSALKEKIQPVQHDLQQLSKKVREILEQIPNLPHDLVPAGTTPEDNELIRKGGAVPELAEGGLPHWELARKYDLIDFALGNKITGSGFPVYKGDGARLQWALIHYFLQYNMGNDYTLFQPPLLVNEETAYGTGQLPDKEGQMYYVGADDFYLVPTSEVPLTNVYRGKILTEEELPVKMTAYTPCFRREAGSYGKDVRGLNRLHQFDKVELVRIVQPESSYQALEEMVKEVEQLLQNLQLPYRILRLCGGDLGFTSAMTYDFEIYSAAQKRWLEVSSVSNFETFQSNRMKIRMKGKDGKKQLLHTLNGSSLALPRILAGLLENNQEPAGIRIPELLQPYMGKEKIG